MSFDKLRTLSLSKRLGVGCWLFCLFSPCLFLHAESPSARIVMTWIPPYDVAKCRARLQQDVDGLGPKDAFTHLGLQFWVPTREGGVEKAPRYKTSDATIAEIRDWAHQNHIRLMLCVYNYVDKWDWPLAQAAFAEHREEFAQALVAEMERLGLDGIDIDLEGNGDFRTSKEPYLAFIRDLSTRVHALHKQVTVDSFADTWNAPNRTWWPELFPLVDAVNSMGYEYIGVHATEWRAYAAQKAAAGDNAAKLLIGMPGAKDQWQGNTAAEHMEWILNDGQVGISIWDASFSAPYWHTPEAWKGLARMRAGH